MNFKKWLETWHLGGMSPDKESIPYNDRGFDQIEIKGKKEKTKEQEAKDEKRRKILSNRKRSSDNDIIPS